MYSKTFNSVSLYMLSPSDQESRSMDDQVKRKFAVTNPSKKRKINNSTADDHSYSESSIDAEFSDLGYTGFATPNNGGGGGGNSNEATPGINDDIINANDCVNDNDEDDEEFLANDEEDNKDDEYFSSFPPGYRFKPYDEELIVYYLRRKIFYEDLPANRIKEVELYKYNPDTLAAKYKPNGENEWFFFTPRDRKYPNGDRPNRAAGGGYWKATGADKTINFNGDKVGLKKALVFYRGKPPRGDKTEWIMHEYRAVDAPKRTRITAHDMKLDDWVLCRIYKKLDRNVKATPRLSDEPIDQIAQTTDNMGNFPIMTGLTGNLNYGDSSLVGCSYHNSNGLPTVPESLDLSIDQTSAYVQQMIFPPLMDSSTFSAPSSSRFSFYHSVPLPYDYPDLSATDFDQLFSTMPSEKGSTSK